MGTTMTVSEARATLPQVLRQVEEGDEVTLTRHGVPVAVVVRPDRLRARRLRDTETVAEELRELMERARTMPLPAATLSAERAEEYIAEIREGRSRR